MKAEDFLAWLSAIAGLSAARRAFEALKSVEGQEACANGLLRPKRLFEVDGQTEGRPG
jgi:hypothetical protein